MVARDYVIGVDQGTSSTKALLLDRTGRVVAGAGRPIAVSHPEPGWVEQDPEAMVANVLECVREILDTSGVPAVSVAGLGIANHTESLVLWDRGSARPVHPAIVWQCRRSVAETRELDTADNRKLVRRRTGLDLDPTFTATKLRWVLRHRPEIAEGLETGRILWGTVDTWISWCLSGGAMYATDFGNASRTMLLDIARLDWDGELAELFGLDLGVRPELCSSGGVLGHCSAEHFGAEIPITALMGDQQASLFGHGCLDQGDVKSTYGTGAFVWINSGHEYRPMESSGCLQTIAWHVERPTYALEGFVMYAGAVLDWLVRHLGLCEDAGDVVRRAERAGTSSGIVLVPAFQGLASPWWKPEARAAILGLDSASGDGEVCHAALESVCFQVRRVLDDVAEALPLPHAALRVDGGLARSEYFLQMQSDILGLPIRRTGIEHLTPYGSALMAGVGAGLWEDVQNLDHVFRDGATLRPDPERADDWSARYRTWCRSVEQCLTWNEPCPRENA